MGSERNHFAIFRLISPLQKELTIPRKALYCFLLNGQRGWIGCCERALSLFVVSLENCGSACQLGMETACDERARRNERIFGCTDKVSIPNGSGVEYRYSRVNIAIESSGNEVVD
jgi:hypothetical protein